MSYSVTDVPKEQWPPLLSEIPQPPSQLNHRGQLPPGDLPLLSVVGSRQYTNYGAQAVSYLIEGLRGYDVGIVSGLALGIDSLAHQAALRAGLYTLAIPGSGLNDTVLYPAVHKRLARNILDAGGGLLSEYEPDFKATKWSFPERNRLVCGISQATLVVEAAPKSGSLITARLATDYNRELLVVPGSIFSEKSKGTHQFLKLGATPITEPADILEVLKLEIQKPPTTPDKTSNPDESAVLALLSEPKTRDEIVRELNLSTNAVSSLLMQMEINGQIKESGGCYYKM